jgi:hypothetical protein
VRDHGIGKQAAGNDRQACLAPLLLRPHHGNDRAWVVLLEHGIGREPGGVEMDEEAIRTTKALGRNMACPAKKLA